MKHHHHHQQQSPNDNSRWTTSLISLERPYSSLTPLWTLHWWTPMCSCLTQRYSRTDLPVWLPSLTAEMTTSSFLEVVTSTPFRNHWTRLGSGLPLYVHSSRAEGAPSTASGTAWLWMTKAGSEIIYYYILMMNIKIILNMLIWYFSCRCCWLVTS